MGRLVRAEPIFLASKLLSLLTVILLAVDHELVSCDNQMVTFHLPKSFRAEGKLTLRYNWKGDPIEHQLAFSEITDATTKRSKISIGYVTYEPNVYYNRDGTIVKVNDFGRCEPMSRESDLTSVPGSRVIPEIDWFFRLSYTQEELASYFKDRSFESGPSLLLKIPLTAQKLSGKFERVETHRSMQCRVSVAKYRRQKCANIRLETFIPPINTADNQSLPFFSVRELAYEGPNDDKLKKFPVTNFTMDYYNMEEIQFNDLGELQRLEDEFSLPAGAGCGEFLPKSSLPEVPNKSFIMSFHQFPLQASISIAYDHEGAYMMRDIYPHGLVSIWDFNEDLLYSIDTMDTAADIIDIANSASLAKPMTNRAAVSAQACSVLTVDESMGSAYRPQGRQTKLGILEYLGIDSTLAYIGRATVRDMPCLLYETILSKPPAVFALDTRFGASQIEEEYDYIVQFYLLRTSTILAHFLRIGSEFWPARIDLIKRHKTSGYLDAQPLSSLDVTDFHWGLFGLDKKPSELFMAPLCFQSEEEQVSLELLFEFRRNNLTIPFDADETIQLRQNKFLLEKELLDDLMATFAISRLHLTEFELTLRQHDALLDMVISDRKSGKRLAYFGEGELIDERKNSDTRLILKSNAIGEQGCISMASHVREISLVSYCPYVENLRVEAQCIAVFNEFMPTIRKLSSPSTAPNTACRMYIFSQAQPPTSGTQLWNKWRKLLNNHEHTFKFKPDSGPVVHYTARVRSFDIEKKIPQLVVDDYRFSLSDSGAAVEGADSEQQELKVKVRVFPNMAYETVGDCARMCNLDVGCKSYSYCVRNHLDPVGPGQPPKLIPAEEHCLLSSLDIRESKIDTQLVSVALENDQAVVKDLQSRGEEDASYHLKHSIGCQIYEKDYLDSFSETGEVIIINKADVRMLGHTSSATLCAKLALQLEASALEDNNLPSQIIAFCPDSQSCLHESRLALLFSSDGIKTSPQNEEQQVEETDAQSSCLVYRRKYQTFFHVSTKVLKRADPLDYDSRYSQVPLELSTVEECAHACWVQLGKVCASFDYCDSEPLCLINSIALDEPQTMSEIVETAPKSSAQEKLERLLELRTGCLHYERDVRLDQLRKSHALNMSLLQSGDDSAGLSSIAGGLSSTGLFMLKTILFGAVAASFVAGLVLGKQINGRLGRLPLVAPGSNGVVNFINNLVISVAGSGPGDGGRQGECSDRVAFTEHEALPEGCIQLEEIKVAGKRDASADELAE